MTDLQPCPCGKTPDSLFICDASQGSKWAFVTGQCCGEWHIEFRTDYEPIDSDECMKLATDAWNEANRTTPACIRKCEVDKGTCTSCGRTLEQLRHAMKVIEKAAGYGAEGQSDPTICCETIRTTAKMYL